MKTLLIAVISLLTTATFAQQPVTWIGGTPGNETNWHEARNWDTNRVPDENSNVILTFTNSGHNVQPVLNSEVVIASMTVANGAQLIIEDSGVLIIDGAYNYSEGISFQGGKVINKGEIQFFNLEFDIQNEDLVGIENSGLILEDKELIYTHKYDSVRFASRF